MLRKRSTKRTERDTECPPPDIKLPADDQPVPDGQLPYHTILLRNIFIMKGVVLTNQLIYDGNEQDQAEPLCQVAEPG